MSQWLRRFARISVVSLMLVCITSGPAVAGSVRSSAVDPSFLRRVQEQETLQTVIVRLSGKPIAVALDSSGEDGWLDNSDAREAQSVIEKEQAAFLESLTAQGIEFGVVRRTSIVFNGLALVVAGCDVGVVARTRSVSWVYESHTALLLDDVTNAAMGVDKALWNRMSASGQKLDGTGTTIGIIDTGIDYTHPDLGGGRFPNAKVVGGYDFADDDRDPMDSVGHGTHVAGIAAADGTVQGVAPKARLYAYKVFSDAGGGADDSDIIAALEQAVRDRCTVVNMSLGLPGGTGRNPETEAVNNAVKAGVVVVAATGNSGPRSPTMEWPLGAPATSLNAIAVAAANDGPYPVLQVVRPIGTGLDNIMGSYADIAPEYPTGASYQVVDAGYGSRTDLAAVNVAGKVALIERGPVGSGGIYFRDKVLNAREAGAAGVIIYNHSPGVLGMTLRVEAGDEKKEYIPCIGITQDAGLELKMLAAQGLTVRFGTRSQLGTMADFSSMGPTEDFLFKPEIAAPGVTVKSTFPGGEYANLDGTSMAAPAIAGAVALVKSAHPAWTPETVKLALMNTADVLRNWQNDESITWTLQGAGRADVPAAIDTPAVAGVSVSDGETMAQTGAILLDDGGIATPTIVTLRNVSSGIVAYTPSFAWTLDERDGVDVSLSPSVVTMAPGETARLSVMTTVDLRTVTEGAHEGILTLRSSAGDLHLPYTYWREDVTVPKQLSRLRTSVSTWTPGTTMDVRFNIGYGGIRPAVDSSDEPQGSSFASQVITTVTGHDGTVLGTIYRKSLLLVGDHGFVWDGRDMHGNLFLADGGYILRTSIVEGNNDSTNLQVTEAAFEAVPVSVNGMSGMPGLRLDVTGGSLSEGDDVRVNLNVDASSGVAGVAAVIRFEPYYLSVKSVEEGSFFSGQGAGSSTFSPHVDAGSGSVAITAGTSGDVVGTGSICTVTFTVLHSGATELWIDHPATVHARTTVEAAARSLPLTLRAGGALWDIDGNKRVDIADLVILARAYGSKAGDERYDNAADLNGDGLVNEADLVILRVHFGAVIP